MIGGETMYVCLDCNRLFTIPVTWRESRGEYFGYPTYEEFMGSPCCKGNYVEAKECSCCGDYITDTFIKTDDGKRYCKDCCTHMEIGDER